MRTAVNRYLKGIRTFLLHFIVFNRSKNFNLLIAIAEWEYLFTYHQLHYPSCKLLTLINAKGTCWKIRNFVWMPSIHATFYGWKEDSQITWDRKDAPFLPLSAILRYYIMSSSITLWYHFEYDGQQEGVYLQMNAIKLSKNVKQHGQHNCALLSSGIVMISIVVIIVSSYQTVRVRVHHVMFAVV